MSITGPDENTYQIPGLSYNNTFNVWKDITDYSTYKLNKLKVYSGVSSDNISAVTSTTEGVLRVTLMPTVTTGHTFGSTVAVVGGLSASALYASKGSTFGSTVYVTGGATFAAVSDHVGAARFSGGLSASALYASTGSTFGSTVYVGGGATFAAVSDHVGAARFSGGLSASALYASTGSTFGSTVYVGGGATFASTVYVGGGATFATTLNVLGDSSFGYNSTGATLGVSGSVFLQRQSFLKFSSSDVTKYLGFKAPTSINAAVTWTLPTGDGAAGQVLSTDGTGVLSWKAADGVTGANKQIQFNINGVPSATAGFVLEYDTAGYSAGTLGVSGGAYIMGNVGVGITTPAIGGRILDSTSTTAKLEVRGDIRIPSGGFFVNKNITIPSGVCAGIGTDENAFLGGVLTVASGATLSISTGGTLVIL